MNTRRVVRVVGEAKAMWKRMQKTEPAWAEILLHLDALRRGKGWPEAMGQFVERIPLSDGREIVLGLWHRAPGLLELHGIKAVRPR